MKIRFRRKGKWLRFHYVRKTKFDVDGNMIEIDYAKNDLEYSFLLYLKEEKTFVFGGPWNEINSRSGLNS